MDTNDFHERIDERTRALEVGLAELRSEVRWTKWIALGLLSANLGFQMFGPNVAAAAVRLIT